MTYIYRAVWPILDPDRTRSSLIAEACAGLDAMARTDGARIVGQPVWTVAGERLVCEVAAEPLDDVEVDTSDLAERDTVVLRLAGLRWSHRQIAATTGVPASTVRDIIARHRAEAA
ncbi:hypothetical protein [Micromonospora chersina]